MIRIKGPKGARKRLAVFGAILSTLALLGLVVILPAQAALDTSLFELDKNAGNDVTTFRDTTAPITSGPLGVLNAAVTVSATSIQVCQFANDDGTFLDPGNPDQTILIDAERMVVNSFTSASGGGCPSGSAKRNYSVTRTAGAAHANGENVTRLTFDAVSGNDWDQVYADWVANNDTKCTDLGAVECTFVHDGRGQSIFTQSKDYDEISSEGGATSFWKWRDQSVPDADELDDGFAIKYSNSSQDLFFGADRFATNGSKDAGFWFFHDDVGTEPQAASGDSLFHGLHTAPVDGGGDGFCNPASGGVGGPSTTPDCSKYDSNDTGGDILILTTFTQGGAVTTIRIYEWFGPAGSTDALFLRSSGSDCVPGPAGASCATVNDTTVESGNSTVTNGLWPYSGKSEPVGNEISSGGFLEGGVNLTDLGLQGCFSSFMATSRSSPSLTADPKDFILGRFEACGASITTAIDDADGTFEIGGSVTDSATVTVTGGGPAPTGSVDFYLCGPSDGITTCDSSGDPAGSADLSTAVVNGNEYTVSSDTQTPSSAGDYCFYAEYPAGQDPNYNSGAFLTDFTDECFTVTPKQPTISTQVNTEDPVSPGTEVWDTATLGNTATPSNGVNGTITFTAYAPDDPTCGGTAVYTSVIGVTGNGSYNSKDGDANNDGVPGEADDAFKPTTPGTYNWVAAYAPDAGDVNNLDASTGCGDAHESSVVRTLQPTMDTAQEFVPNDSATITVTDEAGALAGSVVFELFLNDTCSGQAAYTSDPIDITTGTGTDFSRTVMSGNETAYSTDGDAFYWVVTYTSTNSGHEDVSSPCGNETSSITIHNGETQPPAGP